MILGTAVIPENFRTDRVNTPTCKFIKCELYCFPDTFLKFPEGLLTAKCNTAEFLHVGMNEILDYFSHLFILETVSILGGKPVDMIIDVEGIYGIIQMLIKSFEVFTYFPPAPFKHAGTFSIHPSACVPCNSCGVVVSDRLFVLCIPWYERTNYYIRIEKVVLWH